VISITDPLIVNGLQTSHEIYHHFRNADVQDTRTILVRVIESTAADSVDRIIQATNSQTKIPRIWLHATETIHRKIEIALKAADLYYDRRKNHYRNLGISTAKIVTLPYLSQAVAAIVLQRPDDARGRPTRVADRHYKQMFSEEYPIELYPKCARLLKRIDDFMDGVEWDRGAKNNTVFHLAMYVAGMALKSHHPTRPRIASLDMNEVTDDLIQEAFNAVKTKYLALGGNDRVAKGLPFTEDLKADLKARFFRPAKNRAAE
jgi:hypothetical protein